MTEYAYSAQAYQDYMSARDRTAYWVRSYAPDGTEFYSPSVPPSFMDGHMVLRYNDGRPDIPIPRSTRHHDGRSHTHSHSHSGARSRSGTIGESPPISRAVSRRDEGDKPEQIRILPSNGKTIPVQPGHTRSKSLPRKAEVRDTENIPFPSSHTQSPPYYSSHHSSRYPQSASAHQPGFTPGWSPPHNAHMKHAHANIYAPSHYTQQPPVMLHHQPPMGPNGMIYSHSAPPATGYYAPNTYSTPYPTGSHRHSSSTHDVRRGRTRSTGRRNSAAVSRESLHRSEKSGSTYYHGQKPSSTEHSSSTMKSPTSPYAYIKKPFFQRLFSFPKFSSAGPARGPGGRKLHRRHSIGAR
ncbi:unnamed protein product [Cyclocybe aegerita]|uniref:Uncharacterized protein n=1 Tax=Cyclocybe aegerita TaxID=1973307 RepID=A0A8S0WTJ1_CYCAE|nr:unnamed protein product [Cyclocybe aegerita]